MRHSGKLGAVPGLLVVLAAVTLAAAGCGTPRQPGSVTWPESARTRPASARLTGALASGTRGLAKQTSRRLLQDLVLPPGAQPNGSRGVPGPLQYPPETTDSGHLLQRHAIFAISRPAGWTRRYLQAHVPSGLTQTGSGQSSGPAGPRYVTWSPRHLPRGLYQAELEVSVLAARARTLVRADIQVVWYPPRSSAEYIRPARFSAVQLSVTVFNPRTRTFRRMITSRSAIIALARSLNRLPADPGLEYACPATFADYRITFVPAGAGQVPVVAVPDGCNGVSVTAAGLAQPGLVGGYATIALITRLTGIRAKP
ncbi:MAG: hypothetical protein ACTHJW_13930 [Streptosporangiaceae bacterium]